MASETSTPPQLGNYDILSKIADGGMGTVYKGRHRGTGEIVAVKVIAPTTAKNPVLLQRFEREFMAARVLDHPNIVRAIEYCGTGPHPFLVMEFVDGESIGQRVVRAGRFDEAEAVRLVVQVCEGLQRAHKQGLVHRDVKPDNILINLEGVAKLTDLGLVKDAEDDLNLTKTGRGLGTPHYMAPEQFRNAKGVDVRCDIYSLGATLYAMVTGHVPFENTSPLDCWMKKCRNEFPTPQELNVVISDRVDWAIRRSMSAEPDRRPASCREFVEDLTGQSRTVPQRAAPVTTTADLWYVVYRDEEGVAHTAKGSTEGLRKALRDRLLGDASAILVSRTKTGQFQSLTSTAEFRDLVVIPASMPTPGPRTAGEQYGRETPAGDDDDSIPYSEDPEREPPANQANRTGRPSGSQPRPARRNPQVANNARGNPAAGSDGKAVTELYIPPDADERRPDRPRSKAKAKLPEAKPFDWTPVLLVVVMVVSAVVGFILMSR